MFELVVTLDYKACCAREVIEDTSKDRDVLFKRMQGIADVLGERKFAVECFNEGEGLVVQYKLNGRVTRFHVREATLHCEECGDVIAEGTHCADCTGWLDAHSKGLVDYDPVSTEECLALLNSNPWDSPATR